MLRAGSQRKGDSLHFLTLKAIHRGATWPSQWMILMVQTHQIGYRLDSSHR